METHSHFGSSSYSSYSSLEQSVTSCEEPGSLPVHGLSRGISHKISARLDECPQDTTLTGSDRFRLLSAVVLPGLLAVIPVAMPLGNPFAQNGDNGFRTNWAFYFWYTPLGWGVMWVKMCLWNSELFDTEFCFPFMRNRPGIFKCNGSFAAVLLPTCFATGLYVVGYTIFHNPVPFGTISFGVPCFVATFVCLYICVVPSAQKQTLGDHVRLLRCWIPFLLFVIALCAYTSLIWLQTFVISMHDSMHVLIFGKMSVLFVFVVFRELFAAIPVEYLMGCQHEELAMLWNLCYGAICSSMSDWIFPGMPTHWNGICAVVGVMTTNFALSLFAFRRQRRLNSIEGVLAQIINCICDVISSLAFLLIFSYNAFGPNQDVIYIIAGFSQQEKVGAVYMIFASISVNCLKLAIVLESVRRQCDKSFKSKVLEFGLLALREWYWPVLWLLVSTCTCCGACMVMMHDGMDFTFTFKEWWGTWPFVRT